MAAYLTAPLVNPRAFSRAAALSTAGFMRRRFASLSPTILPVIDVGLQCVLLAGMLAAAALSLLIAAGAAGLLR